MDGTTKKAPFIFRYPFINGDDPSMNGEFPRLGTNTNMTNLPHGRYLAGDLTLLASYEVVIVRQCTSGIAETEDG